MPKRSKKNIIHDERKIMEELQKNAHQNYDTMSKKCGCSRQKVWRFINRIEEDHSIWGYSAIVNYEKQDLKHFTLLMKRSMNPMCENNIEDIISRKFEKMLSDIEITLESSYLVHGEYDWVITFTTSDIKHAKKGCDFIVRMNQGLIEKTNLLETLFTLKRNHILNPDIKNLKEFM